MTLRVPPDSRDASRRADARMRAAFPGVVLKVRAEQSSLLVERGAARTRSACTILQNSREKLNALRRPRSLFGFSRFSTLTITHACVPSPPQDEHLNQVELEVPGRSCSLGNLFNFLETEKLKGSIENYSIAQTTLDQVRTEHRLRPLTQQKVTVTQRTRSW